ncbi:hypothetical protein BZA77DRAFT_337815 [Pyronema omphalodes]|nr:hypothetical protein BZA77DRAFT_337815 [Pyronema omphalodes]
MPSPSKKRKPNPKSTPHKGKTIVDFFSKKSSTGTASSSIALLEESEPIDDEAYARNLAKSLRSPASPESQSPGEPDPSLSTRPSDPQPSTSAGPKPNSTSLLPSQPRQPNSTAPLAPPESLDTIPLDTDPLSFNPESYEYLTQSWPNNKAPYALLTHAFVLINSTRSRIKIVDTLVNFFRLLIHLDPESLISAVWLTTNTIGPPYEPTDLGIGNSILTKALLSTSSLTSASLRKLHHHHGDIGDVAFHAKSKQKTLSLLKPIPLTITHLYNTLCKISKLSGKGSQDSKEGIIKKLLVSAKQEEVRYLVRTLVGNLRIGAVEMTVLIALARAFCITCPPGATWTPSIPLEIHQKTKQEKKHAEFVKAEEAIKKAFAICPNYNLLLPKLLSLGIPALQEIKLTLHTPIKPMLGTIVRSLDDVLTRFSGREFTVEYKYDGQRAQIHYDRNSNNRVEIFSRHLETMTDKYPDLVSLLPSVCRPDTTSFILEGEIVAINPTTGALQNFQQLATRPRKNVGLKDVKIGVCLFVFDLMMINGRDLLGMSLRDRRRLLRNGFSELERRFEWVRSVDLNAEEKGRGIRGFFETAVAQRCEGVMVKLLDNDGYEASEANAANAASAMSAVSEVNTTSAAKLIQANKQQKPTKPTKPTNKPPTPPPPPPPLPATYTPQRFPSWLKLKKDYLPHSSETVDLIPIAAWHGTGRKAKWWSPVLLAVRNPDTGCLEAVCKCMSGFSDKTYREMRARFGGGVPSEFHPAIWILTPEVWEVSFADITVSPVYLAGRDILSADASEWNRGLSLRFPRFIKIRNDKGIEEATTSGELVDLYWKQERAGKSSANTTAHREDDEVRERGRGGES